MTVSWLFLKFWGFEVFGTPPWSAGSDVGFFGWNPPSLAVDQLWMCTLCAGGGIQIHLSLSFCIIIVFFLYYFCCCQFNGWKVVLWLVASFLGGLSLSVIPLQRSTNARKRLIPQTRFNGASWASQSFISRSDLPVYRDPIIWCLQTHKTTFNRRETRLS